MRVLYVTTVGKTMHFFKSYVSLLINKGNTVDIATNELNGESPVPSFFRDLGCEIINIDYIRNPYSIRNIEAIKQLLFTINIGQYDIIHCHTPIASFCTRIASVAVKNKSFQLLYTAHGFHFYKGAPLRNWLLYYPLEWLASWVTDTLITINQEDYDFSKKHLHAKKTVLVPGVGINLDAFVNNKYNNSIREEFSVPQDALLLVSVGELNSNKNHSVIIKAISNLNDSNIHYIIAGEGILHEQLLNLARSLHIESQIHLVGYRNDVPSIYSEADICVFPSIREGQGLAALEGMASGLPIIASDNRGTRGVLVHNYNALICKYNDINGFSSAIRLLADDKVLRDKMGNRNKESSKQFDVNRINSLMESIYLNR